MRIFGYQIKSSTFWRTLIDAADAAAFRASIGAMSSSGESAAALLTKIKTVDGAGSGLDADLLDGLNSADFALADSVGSAEYTPTVSAGVNISATANEAGRATLNGDVLTVTVGMTVTPLLAAGTPTSFEIDLPVGSNLGTIYDLMGAGCFAGGIGAPVLVTGSVANNTAVISFASTLAGSAELRVVFQARIIP